MGWGFLSIDKIEFYLMHVRQRTKFSNNGNVQYNKLDYVNFSSYFGYEN